MKLNQPIKWIVTHDILPQKWNDKSSLIGWEVPGVGSISDPDDNIGNDLGNKSTTDNRIATKLFLLLDPT